jgi:Beta propeller domain
MWRLSWLLTGVLAVSAAAASTAPALPSPTAAQVRPQSFGSCAGLVSYARAHFAVTHGLPDPPVTATPTSSTALKGAAPGAVSASSAASDATTPFSTTNDQEQGVDEPDTVKTNGSTIFTVSGTKLYAVAVNGGKPTLAGSLDLGTAGGDAQLFLDGNRVLVISAAPQLFYPGAPIPAGAVNKAAIMASPYYGYGNTTQLTEVNVSDPSAMKVTQTMSVEGRFVDARQNGATARLIISSAPQGIRDPNVRLVENGWVPTRTFKDLRTGRHFIRDVAPCRTIRHPADFSGLGMLTIITMNFNRGLGMVHSDALMADAQVVYGSQSNLYLATQQWLNPLTPVAQVPTSSSQTTVIDQFDVTNPDSTTLVASGEVPGYLLNQFALSEDNGYLRAATTSRPIWWGVLPQSPTQSYVTVLQAKGGVLGQVGQVSGLGQGEQIYAVRFAGDAAYVVTFHQVDPLYTVDLSKPTAPRVAGELDLAGYSSYLHPLGNGLLLGVGASVDTSSNEPSGTQLELFDVSDLSSPKLLQHVALGQGSSTTVSYDHHAFLYWQPTGLAVLPLQIYGCQVIATPNARGICPTGSFQGAIGFHVARSGISEVGQVVQDPVGGSSPAITRSLVVGDQLYTTSSAGVMASSLSTLSRQTFVAYPA